MEKKLPLKLKVKYIISNGKNFEGKATFHEKNYQMIIQNQNDEKIIRVPFHVMGVTKNEILVRMSGPSGVYTEDRLKFKGIEELIKIESDAILSEISNNEIKFDTLEIFVK